MEYALYWNNQTNQINLAFHARSTHTKIPITQSSLEHPAILQKAQQIIAELNAEQKQARTYQSLLVRCDQTGNTSAALFEKHKPHPQMAPLTDTILDRTYTYSANGFFQINLPVYELALTEIHKHIHTDKVLDLYAGVGTIGLSVASDRDLTLVEVNKSAYTELLNNCQSTPGAKPILAKSEEVLDYISPETTVILDPPRAGCHPNLIEKLTQAKPPTIIYLSCNPITQARDIAFLEKSYKIVRFLPFNFFPRTPHIENLVILVAR